MSEVRASERYEDPAHPTAGAGQRRDRPMKSGMIPVRFTPEMIIAVKRFASQDGVTVSGWIRRLVRTEIQHRQPSATAAAGGAPSVQFDYPPSISPRSQTAPRGGLELFASIC